MEKTSSFIPAAGKTVPSVVGKAYTLLTVLKEGRAREVLEVLRGRWNSELQSFGLRRDISKPFTAPDAAIPISVRLLRDDDIPRLLDTNAPGLSAEGREERHSRRQMLDAGIKTCYVAVTEDDTPCYMQWLIGPEQNELLRSYFKGIFPPLKRDEVLLEGAFTPEEFRGKRIMPAAMARIAERAEELGARWVSTFVTQDNVPSLKGCRRSGFAPHMIRNESWRRFRRRLSFRRLPEGVLMPFEQESGKNK